MILAGGRASHNFAYYEKGLAALQTSSVSRLWYQERRIDGLAKPNFPLLLSHTVNIAFRIN